MKKTIALTIFTIILSCAFAPDLLHAESVFIHDGTILEGKIISSSSTKITVQLPNELSTSVPRGKVLRILRTDQYKRLLEIQLNDGTSLKAHIVDQDAAVYTLRVELASAHEFTVEKTKVLRILHGSAFVSPEEIKYSSAEPVSPRRAALISLIPFKSGSLLVEGTRWPGVSLCILKSVSLILPLGILIGSMGSPDTGGSSNSTSAPISTYLRDRTAGTLFYTGLGVWAASTIGDMVFSYLRVKNHNESQAGISDGAASPVSFFLVPRSGNTDGRETAAIDGFNVSFGVRF